MAISFKLHGEPVRCRAPGDRLKRTLSSDKDDFDGARIPAAGGGGKGPGVAAAVLSGLGPRAVGAHMRSEAVPCARIPPIELLATCEPAPRQNVVTLPKTTSQQSSPPSQFSQAVDESPERASGATKSRRGQTLSNSKMQNRELSDCPSMASTSIASKSCRAGNRRHLSAPGESPTSFSNHQPRSRSSSRCRTRHTETNPSGPWRPFGEAEPALLSDSILRRPTWPPLERPQRKGLTAPAQLQSRILNSGGYAPENIASSCELTPKSAPVQRWAATPLNGSVSFDIQSGGRLARESMPAVQQRVLDTWTSSLCNSGVSDPMLGGKARRLQI